MANLRKFIRNTIPKEWLPVLIAEKKITRYVELVYISHCGITNRHNNKCIPFRIKKLKYALKELNKTEWSRCFWVSADFLRLTTLKEYHMWMEIHSKIQKYKTS